MARRRRKEKELDRYYSLKEAAEIVRVPLSTLRTWTLQGVIPRIKMPGLRGKVLIAERDLVETMEHYREPGLKEIRGELLRLESRVRVRQEGASKG